MRGDFAPLGRRIGAALVDFRLLLATVRVPVVTRAGGKPDPSDGAITTYLAGHLFLLHVGVDFGAAVGLVFRYSAALVALIGQTLGMTVFEVRVVTTRYTRPSILQAVWRYAVAFATSITLVAPLALAFGTFVRVQPHDLLSRTRVVRARDVT